MSNEEEKKINEVPEAIAPAEAAKGELSETQLAQAAGGAVETVLPAVQSPATAPAEGWIELHSFSFGASNTPSE